MGKGVTRIDALWAVIVGYENSSLSPELRRIAQSLRFRVFGFCHPPSTRARRGDYFRGSPLVGNSQTTVSQATWRGSWYLAITHL